MYVAWISPAQKSLIHCSSFLVITLKGDVKNFYLKLCVAEKFCPADDYAAYYGVPSA